MTKPAILGGKPSFEKKIPFVRPLMPDYNDMEDDLKQIISSGMLTKGNYLKKYEADLSSYFGVENAIGVSNCTTGLIITLKCFGLTGEVIVPSFTFCSSVHSIIWNNLTPVFVDCSADTFNINPALVEEAITEKTSAIMAVHIFGNPSPVKELEKIARKHNLKLIFDSAHGLGSLIDGKPPGNYGNGEVFSSSPTKLLVTGEGGIITTKDKELTEKLRIFIEYGNPGDYDCIYAGINGRLSEINSLLGIHSLKLLEQNVRTRNNLAELYIELLSEIPGISFQKISAGCRSSYKDFAILLGKDFGIPRDLFYESLKREV